MEYEYTYFGSPVLWIHLSRMRIFRLIMEQMANTHTKCHIESYIRCWTTLFNEKTPAQTTAANIYGVLFFVLPSLFTSIFLVLLVMIRKTTNIFALGNTRRIHNVLHIPIQRLRHLYSVDIDEKDGYDFDLEICRVTKTTRQRCDFFYLDA